MFKSIGGLFGGSGRSTPETNQKQSMMEFYQSLYPEDVRYALSHKSAKAGKSELFSLVSRFPYEVVYLMIKALASDREQQRLFLEDLTRIYLQDDYDDDLRAFLRGRIEALPEDTTINAAKLAQLSRAGSSRWQQAFTDIAEDVFAEGKHVLPCLIAHTPLLAYHTFVQVFNRRKRAKLLILVPEWMMDPNEQSMGYEITLGDKPSVHQQVKDECVYGSWTCLKTDCPFAQRYCGGAVFIDDTINTGATSTRLRSFWKSEYAVQIPEERVRVITNLRD